MNVASAILAVAAVADAQPSPNADAIAGGRSGAGQRRRWMSSTSGAGSPQGTGSQAGGLGLSQADDGVRAGHRREAVERRAPRSGRQRRVLSRRPSTTHISSAVASVTFSTKKQTAITDRLTTFGRDDRLRLDADHRFQWTSLETNELGTSADTRAGVDARFDFFRLHHTAYYRLRAGAPRRSGLVLRQPHQHQAQTRARTPGGPIRPYVRYSDGTRSSSRRADLGRHEPGSRLGHAR